MRQKDRQMVPEEIMPTWILLINPCCSTTKCRPHYIHQTTWAKLTKFRTAAFKIHHNYKPQRLILR